MGISEIVQLKKKGGVALVSGSEVKIYGRNLAC